MYRRQWHTLGRKTWQAKWQLFVSQKNEATTVEKNCPLLLLSYSPLLAGFTQLQQLPLSLLLTNRIGRCVGREHRQIEQASSPHSAKAPP